MNKGIGMKNQKIDAWHFVPDDGKLARCGLEVAAGYIYSEDGPIELCQNGLHGVRRVYDGIRYASGSTLCKVKMWGEIAEQPGLLVARHREVLAVRTVANELRLWGCWCVRNTPLGDGRTTWDLLMDDSSRNAVEVAERFANGEVTEDELYEAGRAAYFAAGVISLDSRSEGNRRDLWCAASSAFWATSPNAYEAAAGASGDAFKAADAIPDRVNAMEFQANELELRMRKVFAGSR